jgi:hypothetical protein
MCRLKNPRFLLETGGVSVEALTDFQLSGAASIPEAGLDRPLGVWSPGLDQPPPPRAGEGLRDNGMGVAGVPGFGGN